MTVINQHDVTQRSFSSFKQTQQDDNQYIIIDNGSKEPVRHWLMGLTGDDVVLRNHKNVGLPKGLNQAFRLTGADYIYFTHNDVFMYESGWDRKVKDILGGLGSVGVAGFYGALGIGVPGIYQVPYQMQQLVRTTPIAGNRCRQDPKIHGHIQFNEDFRRCAVLDGFSLIVKNDSRLRFDTSFGPHHCYDNDICLQAIDLGLQVITINMDVEHQGGVTDVNEDWSSIFGKTKQQVHQEAHIPFYEKWKPGKRNICMPYRV